MVDLATPSFISTVAYPLAFLPALDPFAESNRYFPTPIQQFQFFDKYSRFDQHLGRRETWVETVDRTVSFLHELVATNTQVDLGATTYARIREAIVNMRSMPSMRLLSMAGPAARRDNVALYNCAFLPVDSVDAFCEALLISMAGTGVGFSVERQWTRQLPRVQPQRTTPPQIHVIDDSAEGWATAVRVGLESWFAGEDVTFNYDFVRPAGAILRTKGGRASGPAPLRQLLDFIRTRLLSQQGQFLSPLDAHDMMCAIGYAVISGGVRRSAMISLFDHDDQEMRTCKNAPDLWETNPQRGNANNSAVWPAEGLSQAAIHGLIDEMVDGMRGEPGIFNRQAALAMIPERRKQSGDRSYGTNPCGEVILRPHEFCNLSISVARAHDTLETLRDKVEVAAIIGTIQSLATYFPHLRPIWKQNCEEERLLGVDITGQLDCPAVWDTQVLDTLRAHVIETNRLWAARLGIVQSAAVTCVKPSGNSAQLLDCSSGIHPRWAPYYIRNVRVNTTSPVYNVLKEAGAPMDPENGQDAATASTWVVHFPIKAPDGGITRTDRTAIEQCDYWLHNKLHWTEHNPSVTIVYRPEEVLALKAWIWEHRDQIGGMAFLPSFDAKYEQMPYEEIDQATYERLAAAFPAIDYRRLAVFEQEDYSSAAQELACAAGVCSIDGVVGI